MPQFVVVVVVVVVVNQKPVYTLQIRNINLVELAENQLNYLLPGARGKLWSFVR